METRGEVLRGIVERTNLERFAERVLDSFWERPDYQRLEPPRDEVRAWVRWNTDLVIRWLTEARPPSEAELERFRQRARDHAAAGIPPDIVPANFRRGARFAWRAMLDAANDEERPALLESADLLFEYVDRVSRIYSELYEAAASSARAAAEELGARALLARIADDEVPLPEDLQLAERIGFQVEYASRPFVLAAHGQMAIQGERGRALDELRAVVEVALSQGRSGLVEVDDHLPELLLRRSPRVAVQLCARVYQRLDDAYPKLARTLDLLVENGFERGRTAVALPVHRNTLRDRINRDLGDHRRGSRLSRRARPGLAGVAASQGSSVRANAEVTHLTVRPERARRHGPRSCCGFIRDG